MVSVRLPRTAVLVAVLAAVWLPPSTASAAVHHRNAHTRSCDGTLIRCLAGTWHERLSPLTHIRNPNSTDALDDLDDRDLGSDPAPATVIDRTATISNPDSAPSWMGARRAVDPRAARLIVWRKLAAPRPPPSL